MSKNDQEEAFEKLVSANLARMIDFVKFAEAKNAALLAFCSAWIVASVNLLTGKNELPFGYNLAFTCALPFFIFAALVCVASALPRTLGHFDKSKDRAKNLLFWGDVASFDVTAYGSQLVEQYMPQAGHIVTQVYLADLANQAAANASTAARKFKMFNIAALFLMIAVGILFLPPLVWGVTSTCKFVAQMRG